ncbi:diacylglycerol kinase [Vibrio sp. vnigr-6D03]|uniref:diacylglycerol kinase n=1 Tax=Vibrio sp. vnigr-6D03 TaxID=2058088 RepID=UPI000C31C0BE|nr:diacylglycerol kinase [Vibrio sp. vnigr-6D03]PKF78835.1 diacylglycerol kinase [Vibrio sp. vnigr-6D03]
MKPGATGLTRVVHATRYSMKGLKAAWINEAAFRQEVVLLVFLSTLTFFLPVTPLEQVAMISVVLLVIIVELLNSAIETVVDRFGSEWNELSGRAKDIGSAAVFVALLLAGLVWIGILFL